MPDTIATKLLPVFFWDKNINGKFICFLFLFRRKTIFTFYANSDSFMQDEMPNLMKQRKPKMVIGQITETHD
ncbi:plasmid maintenance system antidote, XRE family domain protein [Escherichia coli DEC14C]|nr:plasmid maintenance system antidote, XRE family domain protein [Escherichia coli DEC1C]EHX96456.1 plasmid maintenance system antidote, XRE family domain protein [Escherichia coli DEC14C]